MVSQGFSTLLLAPRPGCWLSFSPPVPSFSLPQPVVRSATSSAPLSRPLDFLLLFLSLLVGGFCGGGFRSSGSGASFLSWLRLSCLSPLVSFCCLRSSPDFWLFAVSSSLCALCVVLPAQASLLRSFLSPGSAGSLFPLRLSFLVCVSSSWWHLGVFFCLLSLPSLLLLLRLCWVLFILSTILCWPYSPDLCFPFSSSWASVPWACSYGVLFSGSVGVPLHC